MGEISDFKSHTADCIFDEIGSIKTVTDIKLTPSVAAVHGPTIRSNQFHLSINYVKKHNERNGDPKSSPINLPI